ncbi:hypothetical protein A5784_34940 [Mycobacterium sp. 852013-50091_SCH5140682]|uniref:hypothetical protein n=1 Tax=Mycobacterium sp. 852013-50091_SCH5140682 TaxID=1834109 RepID=UPI0007E9E400|nr:hypothetical protein [Mycobacterium sp. 852013-50091_SCH5140682]OBC11397.1 hypothetical protein A5784_34940 [Mycobacterium sp. 852013-50091_SCH5140682]
MNTCEDETEPLGESPDVPARYDAGIGNTLAAIERGAVIGVLSAADQITATAQLADRQARAITAVRALHPAVKDLAGYTLCHWCGSHYPCATVRAIDEAGA